jgi:hypothetical protein
MLGHAGISLDYFTFGLVQIDNEWFMIDLWAYWFGLGQGNAFLMKSKIGSVWHEIAFQGQVHLVLGIESVKGLLILKVTSHLIFMVQRLKPR